MRRTIHLAVTVVGLVAVTAASAHAQLRLNLRTTPQVRVTPHFNPKEITIDKPLNVHSSHLSRKPKEIVVVGSSPKTPYRANDRLRSAGPQDGWDR